MSAIATTATASSAATASASAAATAAAPYTIYIKIMSGDIISVGIPTDASNHDAYTRIFRALPIEIRPPTDRYLHLMKMIEEEDEEEEEEEQEDEDEDEEEQEEDDPHVYYNEMPFIAQEGDVFCLMIQPATYSIYMNYVCRAQAYYPADIYDCYNLVVTRDEAYTVYSQKVYHPLAQDRTPVFVMEENILETSPTELPHGELITLNEDAGEDSYQYIVQHIIKLGKIPANFRETLESTFIAEWEYQCQSRFPPMDYDDDHDQEQDRVR